MIHPEVRKLLDYPNTVGKRTALSIFKWNSLDKVEEVMCAARVIQLAQEIDKESK